MTQRNLVKVKYPFFSQLCPPITLSNQTYNLKLMNACKFRALLGWLDLGFDSLIFIVTWHNCMDYNYVVRGI